MSHGTLEQKVEALEHELLELRRELGSLAERAREAATETEQASAVGEGENATGGNFEREVESVVEAGKRALHKLDEIAERRPTGSLIVAFLVGLIVARTLGGGRGR